MKHQTSPAKPLSVSSERTKTTIHALKQSFINSLFCGLGRTSFNASTNDIYTAVSLAIRERIFDKGVKTVENMVENQTKMVAYLSAEYLPGPHLENNILNLGITKETTEALRQLSVNIDDLHSIEEEPGLGNGGLGRLASCFMESLATMEVPAIGYGIRYEFGIFDQIIKDGWQVEITDKWLKFGNPWEIVRPEIYYEVMFGGHTEAYVDNNGKYRVNWIPETEVKGVAYDTPILGYKVGTCNSMRLWKAEAIESFDFEAFNHGNYYQAVEDKMYSENITKVLYPNDQVIQGKTLRLKQQYFFVSCSLQDMIRIHLSLGKDIREFDQKWAVQLNDTHPSIAIAELMRLLIDEHDVDWETAWHITQNTCSYTNHTLLPEALEKWPIDLLGKVLPRHLEIILEINHHFIEYLGEIYPGDTAKIERMSIIDEHGDRYVRMANLATIGSKRVNGVAYMHSELVKEKLLHDFYELWPEKFCNVTNGVTPRRFVAASNPELTQLISDHIGDDWIKDLTELQKLEEYSADKEFQKKWRSVKLKNKERLAHLFEHYLGIKVDPNSMFDIQVKRIHEYKRQHLMVLYIIYLYLMLKENPKMKIPPRTFIFGGKAAPGYFMAKLIIKLINSVAEVVNNDKDIKGQLKVVFYPDFNVKNAENIYPAADLSEQISMAGKEASGTGNMKFSLNGALTIGTKDGANVEIREEVGKENFFLFGLTAPEVFNIKARGYNPRMVYHENLALKKVIDFIASGALSKGDKKLFNPFVDNLLYDDHFLVLADFESYIQTQNQVSELWKDPFKWNKMSILNVARMGKFSSDRSIKDYCRQVWDIELG